MKDLALIVLSETLRGLRGELSVARLIDRAPACVAAVAAIVLAAWLAHWCGLHEIWWSAVCAFAITGQDRKTSLNQGIQQILGTAGGTAFGLMLSRYVDSASVLFVVSITCIATVGLYMATSRAASYMWILATSLAIYMIVSSHASPDASGIATAKALSLNAVIGSITYWCVNGIVSRVRIGTGSPRTEDVASSTAIATTRFDVTLLRARNVFAGALTTCMLAYFAWRYPVDGFAQAMTTALVILVVPLHIHRERSMYMVVLRMFHRLLGCLLGSVIGCVLLPVAATNAIYCTVALCAAIWFCCHLRFGGAGIAYAGTQAGAVVILAFVHDNVWFNDMVDIAFERLIGIVAGTIALALVLAMVSSVISGSRFSRASG
jgi:uncharacterized membrane protein YgaE (UPF0421/DUF939 family)